MVEVGQLYNPAYNPITYFQSWKRSMFGHCGVSHNIPAHTGTIVANTFSDFTFRPIDAPLPVEYLAFGAVWSGPAALVQWTTNFETNCAAFEVQRSVDDGRTFEPVGWVDGHGTTSLPTEYAFPDEAVASLPQQRFFYRLKQIDFDGQEAFSHAVELTRSGPEATLQANELVALYPNPVSAGTSLTASYTAVNAGTVLIRAFDATGRLALQQQAEVLPGSNAIGIPIPELTNGVYTFVLTSETTEHSRRIVVLRR
jgi:hypothetical protein